MNIFDYILDPTRHKSAKPSESSASSVRNTPAPAEKPVAQPVWPEPKIVHETRIIDQSNIDQYRSGKIPLIGGFTNGDTRTITIIHYQIADNFYLSPDDVMYKTAKYWNDNEHLIMAHERKHYDNKAFGDPRTIAKNYYELTALFGLDEASAYSAGFLATSKNQGTLETLAAVSMGLDALIKGRQDYVPRHISRLIQTLVPTMLTDPQTFLREVSELKPTYSASFNKIAGEYFTFNGYKVFDAKNEVPASIRQQMQVLRGIYESETQRALAHTVALMTGHKR